jgi:ParB-like chromosome segregation protein Spo0J
MIPWPADKVERWPIAKLIPHPRNARTHSEEQVSQIAASIREWGWTNPILVTEKGSIIAGHGRVLGARELGLVDVPVMVARGWSKAQIQAYALADNKLALNAGWDEAMLALEIGELQEIGFDLGLIGFTDIEIAALTENAVGLTNPDETRCRSLVTYGSWASTGCCAGTAPLPLTSRRCWARCALTSWSPIHRTA